LKKAVGELYIENENVFSVLTILIAVRKSQNKKAIRNLKIVSVNSYLETPELIYEFIIESGLAKVFQNKHVTNLVDYVFGVEVGLDSNARKNRTGKQMEFTVAKIFSNNNIVFEREVEHTNFPELLSLGEDVKRFDFVIKSNSMTYLIEANYYNTGGSKPNETARAYTDIAPKINQYDNFEFVWITDGYGWLSAKNKLGEAYNNIPKVYNLTSIAEFIKEIKNT
jgi:type II restriction enzyme